MKLKTSGHPKLLELEREAGRFCFEMWAQPTQGRLFLLAGNNGTGKSHVAQAVRRWVQLVGHGKQFIKRPGHVSFLDCCYWHWPNLLDVFKAGGWEALVDMFEATLLIIDDLGAAYDPSEAGTDKLCQVLSRREKMWTLITTNIMPPDWMEKFDQRVASRFLRNSTLVDLSEVPDYNG